MASRGWVRVPFLRAAGTIAAACTVMAVTVAVPAGSAAAGSARGIFGKTTRFAAGFSIETPAQVASAARDGVTADILYGGPPGPSAPLGRALARYHMTAIDARLSGELFYWECHRTHTVAPPPKGQPNDYCAKDEKPGVDSAAVVLKTIGRWLKQDAANPLVSGYWVLDDWPYWDGGSARGLLREIRREIRAATPGYPAICGFGGTVLKPGHSGGFDLSTAENYSNGGCDMVGWYNYASIDTLKQPSKGSGLDWSMKLLLATEGRDLAKFGWSDSRAPLLGIGQAWYGRYDKHYYQAGLTVGEMLTQARAFCSYGATAIGWYAWNDSGYGPGTQTPNNSAVIRAGIKHAVSACGLTASPGQQP
jgi:hypothetical protein